MAPPNLDVVAQPDEGGTLAIAMLAPSIANGLLTAQCSLRLDLTSQQPGPPLEATQVEIGFVPPPDPKAVKIPMSIPTPDGPSGVTLYIFGTKQVWHFSTPNNFFLMAPFPASIYVSLLCKNYDPLVINRQLTPHPTSYRFPFELKDRVDGNFWQGQSGVHLPGIVGWSLFAYNLVSVGWDAANKQWSELDGDVTNVKSYRAYGQPVYAMADGVVVSVRNDVPDEPISATLPPFDKFDVNDLPNAAKPPISGNHVKIATANGELVTHAHLQAGTVPPNLTLNTPITAGTLIGRVGNSGQSAKPNLMVGVCRLADGVLLPCTFKEICVIGQDLYDPAAASNPWFVYGKDAFALPPEISLIWPAAGPPLSGKPHKRPEPVSLPTPKEYMAIDPLARVISSSLYATLTKPRPSGFSELQPEIAALLERLTPEGRKGLRARLDALKQFVSAIERMLDGMR